MTLIRTKVQRPRLLGDLIPRRRLMDRLRAGSERKLTLISAIAGTGKTTLLPTPAASLCAMLEGLKDAGLEPGDVGITESLLDARSLLLTPNTTTP